MSVETKYCTNCANNKIEHEFQDKQYGKFNRIFNIGEKSNLAVCTVCNNGRKVKK